MTTMTTISKKASIEKPATGDISDIVSLINGDMLKADGTGHLLRVDYATIANAIGEERAIAGYVDGALAGFVRIKEYDGVAELSSLRVYPEYESAGIGSALTRSAIELAIELGHTMLYVYAKKDTLRGDTKAYDFFKKFGFITSMATPEKLAEDCAPCPIRAYCVEVPMVLDLRFYQP